MNATTRSCVPWFVLSAVVATACAGPDQTAIDLAVAYDDSWSLSEFQVTTGDLSRTIAASHRVTILVPDDWAGTEMSLEIVGMQGTEAWARGTKLVTPVLGETVIDVMGLALLSCATTCVEDAMSCRSGGVAHCEQAADSCFGWSVPVPCGGDTPFCSVGACVAAVETVHPSNADVVGELQETGLILDVPTGAVFDTTTGCVAGSAIGNCTTVSPTGLPQTCVCRSDELTIHDLEVTGTRALVILARRSVTISGLLTVKPGAGASPETALYYDEGGSYGTHGGGSSPSTVWGTLELVPLVGGKGNYFGNDYSTGGGAIQITADEQIRIDGGISTPGSRGNIQTVSTCSNAAADHAGYGGGSGGAILLEARQVLVAGVLAANGGSGSGGGWDNNVDESACGSPGTEGAPGNAVAAPGGAGGRHTTCQGPAVFGGDGGDGSLGDSAGLDGSPGNFVDATGFLTCTYDFRGRKGGGGGGAGRVRINTADTGTCCTGTFSPSPTFGTTVLQ